MCLVETCGARAERLFLPPLQLSRRSVPERRMFIGEHLVNDTIEVVLTSDASVACSLPSRAWINRSYSSTIGSTSLEKADTSSGLKLPDCSVAFRSVTSLATWRVLAWRSSLICSR